MGKISASRIPDKGLILRVHKEFLQLNVKKRAQFKNGQRNKHFSKEQTTQSKNGQKTLIDTSPKKIYRLATNT